jgi:ankyrin repeat protein
MSEKFQTIINKVFKKKERCNMKKKVKILLPLIFCGCVELYTSGSEEVIVPYRNSKIQPLNIETFFKKGLGYSIKEWNQTYNDSKKSPLGAAKKIIDTYKLSKEETFLGLLYLAMTDKCPENQKLEIQNLISGYSQLLPKPLPKILNFAILIEVNKTVINILLEKKADINAKNKVGDTPIHIATRKGNKEIVSVLLEQKADINAKNKVGDTPIHIATRKGNKEIVSVLLEQKADINAKNKVEDAPIHIATRNGNKEIVSVLLEKKAAINAKNKVEDAPIHIATRKGNKEIVSVLLEKKADINAKNKVGDVPIFYATSLSEVKTLIENNADPKIPDKTGRNCIYHFIAKLPAEKTLEIIEYLNENYPTIIDTKDGGGFTPLHFAVLLNKNNIVEKFIKLNTTNINMADNQGFTPLELAILYSLREIKDLFPGDALKNINPKKPATWDDIIIAEKKTLGDLLNGMKEEKTNNEKPNKEEAEETQPAHNPKNEEKTNKEKTNKEKTNKEVPTFSHPAGGTPVCKMSTSAKEKPNKPVVRDKQQKKQTACIPCGII